MYEDGIDGDSLKEVLESAIKRIDIGTAVLPEPLFHSDVDEPDEHGADNCWEKLHVGEEADTNSRGSHGDAEAAAAECGR